ncbi:MAG TPA: SufE family protein [Candidatus Thiothrix moscowensis]|uniref:SufE family protein n=1 Tax=unclassified Thiothrix TaxID=2636184 RepID=UPI0025D5DB31|nr:MULTISPECIES: SufE family protein [unclassified Thiothrix]HRJ54429.1 SufE family protein [Candidatus Thiothrix moscowensis]HRJ94707.1 SufE family protein [Candidatus Thiothrix moscowensis]
MTGSMTFDDISSDFAFLDDWEQRYQYLTELGEALEPMPETEKTEDNRVKACMSKVWVRALPDPDGSGKVIFHGDCDTAIIKGVVALLVNLFSSKSPQQIVDMDVDALFDQIQLAENLSPTRHVGIYAIVDKMRAQAQALITF